MRIFTLLLLSLALSCQLPLGLVASAQDTQKEQQKESEQETSEQEDNSVKEYAINCSREAADVELAFSRALLYLRELSAVRSRFMQYSQLGVVQEGDFFLYPPYRMRLDYDAPSGLRLYVNAQEAMHVDTERRFVRRYPLFSLPAVRMLQRIFSGRGASSLVATRICTLSDKLVDNLGNNLSDKPDDELDATTNSQARSHYEYLRVKFRKKKKKTQKQAGREQNNQVAREEDARGYAELYFALEPNYRFIGWDLHSSGAGTTRIRLGFMTVVDEPKISTFRFTSPWHKDRNDK